MSSICLTSKPGITADFQAALYQDSETKVGAVEEPLLESLAKICNGGAVKARFKLMFQFQDRDDHKTNRTWLWCRQALMDCHNWHRFSPRMSASVAYSQL